MRRLSKAPRRGSAAGVLMLGLGTLTLTLAVVLRLVASERGLEIWPAMLLKLLSVVVIVVGTSNYPPPDWWPFGDGHDGWFGNDDGDGDFG